MIRDALSKQLLALVYVKRLSDFCFPSSTCIESTVDRLTLADNNQVFTATKTIESELIGSSFSQSYSGWFVSLLELIPESEQTASSSHG